MQQGQRIKDMTEEMDQDETDATGVQLKYDFIQEPEIDTSDVQITFVPEVPIDDSEVQIQFVDMNRYEPTEDQTSVYKGDAPQVFLGQLAREGENAEQAIYE